VEEAISGIGDSGSSIDCVGLEGGGFAFDVSGGGGGISGFGSSEVTLGSFEASGSSSVHTAGLFGVFVGLLTGSDGSSLGSLGSGVAESESSVDLGLNVEGSGNSGINLSVSIGLGLLSGLQVSFGDNESLGDFSNCRLV